MRGETVQINWHDTKPVLTLDFHPSSGLLATAGADFDIKLWAVKFGDDGEQRKPTASYQNSLTYHGSAVNVIRFAPHGELLASGADGGEMILWKLQLIDAVQSWKVLKTLSFHRKDVLDLQWSSDGAFLVTGSVDNSCIIWDINKGSVVQILDAHLHYVQGVAWDPLANYIASLSSDRTCRIYVNKPQKSKGHEKLNFVCQHVISKLEPHSLDESKSVKSHLFLDETLPSFFRRLAWSPDGSFLLVPAGTHRFSPASEPTNTCYIISRNDLTRPALMLPGASKAVIAVRFCPVAFKLRGSNSGPFFELPYRLVFAVATLNSLYIYDTESIEPIAVMAGLHYAAITDMAWSHTGNYLAVSSQDGYCTLVEFENDELGLPVPLTGLKVEDKGKSFVDKSDDMAVEIVDNLFDKENLEKSAEDERKSLVDKPDDMAVEVIADNVIDKADSVKSAESVIDEKKAPVIAPVQNRPAKRRITPMAID